MTREELWEEFENQLIRETRTSMTMNFDTAERMTKLGIKETVAKWKDRLEQEPCEDAVSRAEVVDELNRLGRNAFKDDTDYDNFFAFLDSLPSVTPTKCIATVKFSKEDMRELINEKMKDIVVERKKGKWVDIHDREEWYGDQYRCSLCGKVTIDNGLYCPNCGAEMEIEE